MPRRKPSSGDDFPEERETYRRGEQAIWKWVLRAQLDKAIAFCERELALLPESDYHAVLGRSWLAQTESAADWLASFWSRANADFSVQAIYGEMNRFEINTDEWHVHGFAYDAIGDPDETGWLCGWKAASGDPFVLEGMDDLKEAFRRDIGADRKDLRAPMEWSILLLTLRMQELLVAATARAWREAELPVDVPVLSTAHDCDMLCIAVTEAGKRQLRKAKTAAKKMPPPSEVRADDERGPGVYRMESGWDANHNSLPWDHLRYAGELADLRCLERTAPLAARWKPIQVDMVRRKWRCDIPGMYPAFAVNSRARESLSPLLGNAVEFLPLDGTGTDYFVVHPLREVPLGPDAVTNERSRGDNVTVIREYDFNPQDVAGLPLFLISQPPDSDAARYGGTCTGTFVSDDFVRAVESSGLRGVVFKRVFRLGDRG